MPGYYSVDPLRHTQKELTLDEIMRYPLPSQRNKDCHPTKSLDMAWATGGVDLTSREKLMRYVAQWRPEDAAQRLREYLSEDIALDTSVTRPRRRNHVEYGERIGDGLEYERFRRGVTRDQRFWERRERRERRHSGTVTMHVNIGLRGGESPKNLVWSGACALALTDLLESIGYRVNMFAVITSSSHPSGSISVRANVKREDERLSDQMIALISDGGVRRACWWTFLAGQTDFKTNDGFGNPIEYEGDKKADITVPMRIITREQAISFVRETMAKYKEDR